MMKIQYTPKFKESFQEFSEAVRKKFYKQIEYLLSDIRHPSLRVKKYDEKRGIWQARVDKRIRFYFLIEADTYYLLDIKKHPK